MSPVNDAAFDKPPKQRSFVVRMAMKTKSQVQNFKSYKTISLLPRFLRPDSRTWTRFDQDTTEFCNNPGPESGQEASPDISGSVFAEESSAQSKPQRPSFKERLRQSRLNSLRNYAKRNRASLRPKDDEKPKFPGSDKSSRTAHPNYFDSKEINIVVGETSFASNGISRNGSEVFSIPEENKEKSEWKSCMKDLENGRYGDGFWRECRFQMNKAWQIFTGETTAHGYKRTTAPHRSRIGKLFWGLAIFGVSCIVMAILYNTVVDQDLYSFSSSIKSEPHVRMAFPAVTVCNLAPYDYSRIKEPDPGNYSAPVRDFLLQVADLQNFAIPPTSSDSLDLLKNFTTKDLHDLIGWKLDTFIKKCYWNEIPVNCSEVFVQSMTVTESCFTFNFDPNNLKYADRVGSLSGLNLLIDVGAFHDVFTKRVPTGMKVLLHEPMEFPNTRENGMLVAPGSTTYVSAAKNVYKFLPKPFKAYGTQYCSDLTSQEDEEVGENKVRYYNYTGYSSCVAECRLRAVLDKCGCVVYGRDPDIRGVPYCSMDKYATCYIPTLQNTFIQSPLSNCACPLPCKKVEYPSQMSSADFQRTVEGVMFLDLNTNMSDIKYKEIMNNYVELKIFYKALFTHIEEHLPMYTWLTIFGNVGGQMGLFTGASVMTILEFLELFVVIIWLILATIYRYIKIRWRSDAAHLESSWKQDNGHLQGIWRSDIGQP